MNVEDSRPIVWIRDLFLGGASVESMIRWMLIAWLVLMAALVIMDRLGNGLLGRSKPLVQVPPPRARGWRWGRSDAPVDFSSLPSGTVVSDGTPTRPRSIPLARPLAIDPVSTEHVDFGPDVSAMDDDEFWLWLAGEEQPTYGAENVKLLELARAPERYNPVLGRVEQLGREDEGGRCEWPADRAVERIGVGSFGASDDDLYEEEE